MAKKQQECIFKGWEYPDGTLHTDPPEEFIARINRVFQIEYELSLREESSSVT